MITQLTKDLDTKTAYERATVQITENRITLELEESTAAPGDHEQCCVELTPTGALQLYFLLDRYLREVILK